MIENTKWKIWKLEMGVWAFIWFESVLQLKRKFGKRKTKKQTKTINSACDMVVVAEGRSWLWPNGGTGNNYSWKSSSQGAWHMNEYISNDQLSFSHWLGSNLSGDGLQFVREVMGRKNTNSTDHIVFLIFLGQLIINIGCFISLFTCLYCRTLNLFFK